MKLTIDNFYKLFANEDFARAKDYDRIFATGFSSKYAFIVSKILSEKMQMSINLFHFPDINTYNKYKSFTQENDALQTIKLTVSMRQGIDNISRNLVKIGYTQVRRVQQEGQFTVLGDVLIVYPFNKNEIVRVSYWGNDIEQIALSDPISRKAIKNVNAYIINGKITVPTKEFLHIQQGDFDEKMTVIAYGGGILIQEVNLLKDEYKKQGSFWLDFKITDILQDTVSIFIKLGWNVWQIDWELAKELGVQNSFKIDSIKCIFEVEQKVQIGGDKVISVGDMVVHNDHGIAVYEGIVSKEVDGEIRSYLNLRYAGNDRLFVPFEQADKISLYIGIKRKLKGLGRESKLTKLNSGGWRRSKKIAQIEAKKIADELLRIEAIRKSCNLNPIVNNTKKELDIKVFVKSFGYKDTDDQLISTMEIIDDLKRNIPMDRLLVGDVGFGKTEIALRASFAVINSGGQVAFLAPTTVLVSQHKEVIKKRFANVKLPIKRGDKYRPVCVESLSRLSSKQERESICDRLIAGEIDILVGTHAILSDAVRFANLGLVVIDEEQKFGVKQKEKLKSKRAQTHVLSMSATPIPRTLGASLAGVRDISVLTTPIPGRLAIKNVVSKFNWDKVKLAISNELMRRGQVYFLHNKVKELEYYAVQILELFPDARVATVHGRMSGVDLARIMGDFARGDIDVLVCTTIIENGLDLPNANTLIINTPERLGLSQMYQIRGRIGRSDKQAWTYILYKKLKGDGKLRVQSLDEHQELGAGFMLANRDLEIRGAGNILGKEQSGMIASVGYELFMKMVEGEILNFKF